MVKAQQPKKTPVAPEKTAEGATTRPSANVETGTGQISGQVTFDKWTGKFTQTWVRLGIISTPEDRCVTGSWWS